MSNSEFVRFLFFLPAALIKLVLAFVLFLMGWRFIGEGIYNLCQGLPQAGESLAFGLAGIAPFSAGVGFLIYSTFKATEG